MAFRSNVVKLVGRRFAVWGVYRLLKDSWTARVVHEPLFEAAASVNLWSKYEILSMPSSNPRFGQHRWNSSLSRPAARSEGR